MGATRLYVNSRGNARNLDRCWIIDADAVAELAFETRAQTAGSAITKESANEVAACAKRLGE
jgi:hypothetical protein